MLSNLFLFVLINVKFSEILFLLFSIILDFELIKVKFSAILFLLSSNFESIKVKFLQYYFHYLQ